MLINDGGKMDIKKEGFQLLDFYATWCVPCKQLAPTLEKLSEENRDLSIVKINVEQESELAVEFKVMSVPTLILLKDGIEIGRKFGNQDYEKLKGFVTDIKI